MSKDAVIVSYARTPIGSFQGTLQPLSASALGSIAIKALFSSSTIASDAVDEVIMGNVISAGCGQAPARQAAIGAGIPSSVPCTTVNKVCGSGLKAVMMGRQSILLGEAKIVVAGGMESMSNAPYLLPTARKGMRMGNQVAVDSMISDGLWDPYGNAHMGNFGDQCAKKYEFSRQEQDLFAQASYERALFAQKNGLFDREIAPVNVQINGKALVLSADEEPARYQPEKMSSLKAAFSKDGTVTAANASKINDGAAALLLMSDDEAQKQGYKPLVKIIAQATAAHDPSWFTTAPIKAMNAALAKASLAVNEIDLFEINEAFAVVPMAAMRELKIPREKVNVYGGAIALGHPLGASGARILCTLISAMTEKNARYGCASLCLGGGEAVAVILERNV